MGKNRVIIAKKMGKNCVKITNMIKIRNNWVNGVGKNLHNIP